MSPPNSFRVRVESSISAIPASQWDACANPCAARGLTGKAPVDPATYNPFISHAFLAALEESGSATVRTGWQPCHLIVEDQEQLLAAMPCYIKSHSLGEYVFDHGWADAYERAGGRYYPKLQVCVPFTPVTGPRLLARPGAEAAKRLLGQAASEVARRLGASSVHVAFLTEAESRVLGGLGYLQRSDRQFHWANDAYGSFEAFLESLSSRKRKMIRRERREALQGGVSIEWITGQNITEAHWDAFFDFYMDTGSRKWGRPYLTRRFFSLVGERMSERILLVIAKRAGRYVAGAINFIGEDTLYGRNWGCIEDHPFLHFEVCYYQAIEFAIAHGLKRVEAGAQGAHKLARGYLPATTYSAHWIADASLRRAIADYLVREQRAVATEQAELSDLSPFRHRGRPEEPAPEEPATEVSGFESDLQLVRLPPA